MSQTKPHIVILGGGYIGLYSALGLEKTLRARDADITLVNPESFMVYQPFLPEVAAGSIEPRRVVVPLRRCLDRTRLINGEAIEHDPDDRKILVEITAGVTQELHYDVLIVGLGSVSRVLPVPGLSEQAVGFKTVAEAVYLRNKVLASLDLAESTDDPDVLRRALTFLFVGGGYGGVEALGELENLARQAVKRYRRISRENMRFVLVEAANGILPEIGEDLGNYAVDRLRRRGIEVYLNTRLEEATGGCMALSNGQRFEADTLVWTTGVKPHPLIQRMGLPTGERGRLVTDAYLRVEGAEGIWAGGDCAAVPDLIAGGFCPPTAQHALRQARVLASNVAASLQHQELKVFRYRTMGLLASLGRHDGVARVMKMPLLGIPAWITHRAYHLTRIPTLNRKVRVFFDWMAEAVFKKDIVQLGTIEHPREAFSEALEDAGQSRS